MVTTINKTSKDFDSLLGKGEIAVTDKYPTELTAEVITRLSAPVPASELQTKQQGGTTITFTSDKFVIRRLNDVLGVAGWQDDYVSVAYAQPIIKRVGKDKYGNPREIQLVGTLTCHLKVLGVMKSAEVDLEFENSQYGTPATNAQARAFKRAAMKFGIAADLWDKDATPAADESEPAEEKVSQFKRPTQKQGSGGASANGPSPKQVNLLKELHVPTAVISKLTAGKDGSATQLISDLLTIKRKEDDYDDEPLDYIAAALKKIDRRLVALLDQDEEDEDED